MRFLSRISRNVGLAIILLIIAATSAGYFLVRQDLEKIRVSNREELLWPAVQVEIELMRFQAILQESQQKGKAVDPRLINIRFDMLWSDVSLFEQGTVGARLRFYDRNEGTMAALSASLREIEPLVVGLVSEDQASIQKIKMTLEPFNARLQQLSQNVLHGESKAKSGRREDLANSSFILMLLSMIALSCSLILIVFFARDTAHQKENAERILELLNQTKDTARSKSRFLAMVSHDLRTPMNGVLGLLALVRQRGLNDAQNALMLRAERSGGQMISLLEDVLDYSALQDDQLALECKPFEIRVLASAISDVFQPNAVRQGTGFRTSIIEPVPRRVCSDFSRVRQAVVHIANYVLETAGTKDIELEVGYTDGWLTASVIFDYSKPGVDWQPELILGTQSDNDHSFVNEALGPSVSRGLIEKMGGTIKLNNRGERVIEVLLSVPAEELVAKTIYFRIMCQSAALETICRVAMGAKNIEFLNDTSPQAPHVIILEAGGENEKEKIERIADTHPKAILVALGKPANPEVFDDIVSVPIDVASVRRSGFMRLVTDGHLADEQDLRYAGKGSST